MLETSSLMGSVMVSSGGENGKQDVDVNLEARGFMFYNGCMTSCLCVCIWIVKTSGAQMTAAFMPSHSSGSTFVTQLNF